ncbi:DUF502 domain-containing protein [Geoalkalibacter sp.]|uniref:DUF502 domain-containing protein n=1 Tax=Geoalkalibacter sp. TaxID=3041440 RepID=UPI00272E5662|nr:DUF502 domain-containing protein [Geoalkalibacter sp.]
MEMTLKSFGKIMVRGLMAMLPALLTLYILYWLVWSAETFLGAFFRILLPEGWYIPGMGLLAGVAATFFFGLMLNAFLMQKILGLAEAALNRIPLIKTLYGSVKDFISFFAARKEREFNQVVAVELTVGGTPMRLLGFVTRSDFEGLPEGIGHSEEVAVYLPLSYQIGGYTVIVPRHAVMPIDITPHRAMGFVLTGGMFTEKGFGQASTDAKETSRRDPA